MVDERQVTSDTWKNIAEAAEDRLRRIREILDSPTGSYRARLEAINEAIDKP